MRIPAILLLALAGLPASPGVLSEPELLSVINAMRERGCAGEPGGRQPLRPSPGLDRVAARLAAGRSLRQAIGEAEYRAVRSAMLEVTGGDEAIRQAVAERGCEQLIDAAFSEAGIARSAGTVWIVAAAPLVPPPPGEAGRVGERILALVNETRARPRRCGWRRFDAAPPLALSEALGRAALAHARDMARRGRLDHAGHDGSSPAERATRAGYRWRLVGENIAAGQATPEQAVAEWVGSPRHCANLMSADYTEMGVAFASDPGSAAGVYWAQVLAAPRR